MLQLQRERYGSVSVNPATGESYTDAVNTDWVDYFFRTGVSTDHQFSVSTKEKNMNTKKYNKNYFLLYHFSTLLQGSFYRSPVTREDTPAISGFKRISS